MSSSNSIFQAENEAFYAKLVEGLNAGVLGTCALALRETMRPDMKLTKSTLMGTVLRLGDPESRAEEALEINIKTSKCTALNRPKSWKKFAAREKSKKVDKDNKIVEVEDEMDVDEPGVEGVPKKVTFAQLKMRTEYYVDRRDHNSDDEDGDVKMEEVKKEPEPEPEVDEDGDPSNKVDPNAERVDKEDLIRGFKYGTTYVPCPDGQFGKLPTKKGIEICGFFLAKNVRHNLIHSRSSLNYMI
jgi:ATP-dependent DNA helicase 2 subunit 2